MIDSSELQWRAAVHESGHVIADYSHQFEPVEVHLGALPESVGSGRVTSRDDWAVPETAERYVISCLAGPEAERAFGFDDQLTVEGESSDVARAEQAIRHFGLKRTLNDFRAAARTLVVDRKPAIERVAKELLPHGRLVGEELLLVVRAAHGVAEAESDLVRLRSGEIPRTRVGLLKLLDGHRGRSVTVDVPRSALLVGDLPALQHVETLIVRPYGPVDLERVAGIIPRLDLSPVVEILDGDAGEVISLEAVRIDGETVILKTYNLQPD